ncbi:F178B protein, partial [Psophia crepitans]|nr:F178B protein [Psophia crepitans]
RRRVLRWFQIPLPSARVPRSVLFSYRFQAGLRRYRQLRARKRLPRPPPALPGPPAARGALGRHEGTAWSPPHRPHRPLTPQGGPWPSPRCPHRPQGGPWPPPRCPRSPPSVPKGSLATPVLSPQPTGAPSSPLAPRNGGRAPAPCGALAGRSLPESGCPGIRGVPWGHPTGCCGVTAQASPSPCSVAQAACPQLDPRANSLDSLVQEKREQSGAATRHAGPAWAHTDAASPCESPEEDVQLSEEQRDFLARFTVELKFIPTVHPGERVFCARLVPAPTLDTSGLEPQSALERFFLRDSPACQAAFVRSGALSLLYRCLPACPLPVLRWLFQLMTLCPDTTNASQALWEIWLSTTGEPWCPTVREISQAFARLGADLSPLCHRRLLPPELCPAAGSLDPSCPPRQASPDAASTLALVTQLGDICKFLALCVVPQPCHYADGARLSLVTLLSFLGLDRALRCQPLPELQHLLHCLLEGIRAWREQGPPPMPEPSCHGLAAEGAAGCRATRQGARRAAGGGPAPGAGTARRPATP